MINGIFIVPFLVLTLIFFWLRIASRIQRAPMRQYAQPPVRTYNDTRAYEGILRILQEFSSLKKAAHVQPPTIQHKEALYVYQLSEEKYVWYTHTITRNTRFEKMILFPMELVIEYENDLPFCISMHAHSFAEEQLMNLSENERRIFIDFARTIREACIGC